MPSMDAIRERFRLVNPSEIEACLGENPQLLEPIAAIVPLIEKHFPEAGVPVLKCQVGGSADFNFMIHISLPDSSSAEDSRRRLGLLDDEWWTPLPIGVRSILLADIRWGARFFQPK